MISRPGQSIDGRNCNLTALRQGNHIRKCVLGKSGGKSEVVGLAGNPDQAYGAELAERGYPAPRAFDSLEPRDFAIHGRRLRRCWNVAIDPASTSAFHRP
jgi:hypothetical protein